MQKFVQHYNDEIWFDLSRIVEIHAVISFHGTNNHAPCIKLVTDITARIDKEEIEDCDLCIPHCIVERFHEREARDNRIDFLLSHLNLIRKI